jgi:hypothetical protein
VKAGQSGSQAAAGEDVKFTIFQGCATLFVNLCGIPFAEQLVSLLRMGVKSTEMTRIPAHVTVERV